MVELHSLHLQDLQNPLHPSTFEEYRDYHILVLRLPEQIGKISRIHSYGFIIAEDTVYYYDQTVNGLVQLAGGLNELYRFLDDKIDTLMNDIETVQDKIVAIEESLYKKFSSGFMEHWHEMKKELSHSERIILKAVDILERFITKSKSSKHFPINEFNDLHEHLERTLRSNVSANDQLDNLYSYYNLRANDRMNRSIYILTIISVVFLPLNLVVGFFGMNTGGMPFEDHAMGTFYAFVTMILFTGLLTSIVLWKIRKR